MKNLPMTQFILTTIIFLITWSRLCTAGDTLLQGQTLSGDRTLVSKNGIYELGLFVNYYYNGSGRFLGIWLVSFSGTVLWVANRGNPIQDPFMPELNISSTGNLVLTQSQELIWSTDLTRSDETTSTIVVLLDTGNLVLKEENSISRIVWQSFDHPTDTWFAGAPLGFNAANGNNVYLTSTYIGYSGSIMFSLELDPHRASEFIIRHLSDNATYYGIFPQLIHIVDDSNGLVTFNVPNNNYTYIQLNGDKIMFYWLNNDQPYINAISFDDLDQDQYPLCNFYSFCGPYGLCSNYGTCICPKGFHPAYPEDWAKGYYSTGCSRNIPLNCQISRNSRPGDVFHQIININNYPDDPQFLGLKDETECAAACLSNCSCNAYSYQNKCSLWFGKLQNTVLRSDGLNGYKMNIKLAGTSHKFSWRTRRFIIMLALGAAALLVVGLLVFWKRKAIYFNQKDEDGNQLVAYSYAQTKNITKNFFHRLGEGGFGSVFKGSLPNSRSLPNSTAVAVKRMKNACSEEKQFRTEVQTIGMIQHINLVKLLGFCSEGTRRLLVYEYMPNGSLDSNIFSNHCDDLNWNTRYEIMVGIARGLTYLHEECRDCIIHCDIKPENILLDVNFCPKIADFGMAKLLGRDFSRALTTFRGTIGYLGPEWISGQPITKKADVYSFGMMLFEIISGKRNIEKFKNPECTYFPLYAAMKTRQGEIVCLLDDRLQGNAKMGELNIACKVACWCIQEMETDRPSMREVVQMLDGVVEVSMPPIPSFLQRLVDLENDSTYSVAG